MGIKVDGATLSCARCGVVVYPDCRVLANHDITALPDGRVQWWSRDFETTVHLCTLPATAVALEQVSGLVLDFLASRGLVTSRS